MISIRINNIINIVLKYFVRVNYNRSRRPFKKVHKSEFAIFFNDSLSNEIITDGVYEKDEISLAVKNIKKNGIILDIGANIGNHSIFFSKYCKEVYAFEAHPKTFKILNFNCSNYNKIKLFNLGVSDRKGYLFFKKNTKDIIGGRSLKKKGIIKSKINKLDNILKIKNKISLIKIDIEGGEYRALIGMEKLIKKNSSIIFIEFREKSIFVRKQLINFLVKNDYLHAYYFNHEGRYSVGSFVKLIKDIFKIIFLSFKNNKTELKKMEIKSLIKNNMDCNVIFSKKKLNKLF